MLRNEESREFLTSPFSEAIWERMEMDYARKDTDGVRRLNQMGGRKSDGLKELRRVDRHSHGMQFPRNFSMGTRRGYWRSFVFPKIDLWAGRADGRGALRKALASCGVSNQVPKVNAGQIGSPNSNGVMRGKVRTPQRH